MSNDVNSLTTKTTHCVKKMSGDHMTHHPPLLARLEAMALRLEAIALKLEAIAISFLSFSLMIWVTSFLRLAPERVVPSYPCLALKATVRGNDLNSAHKCSKLLEGSEA